MRSVENQVEIDALDHVHPGRLFLVSCMALVATSISFAVVGAIMGPLKQIFILTNAQVGIIGGAQLWGFAVTMFIFGPLCDVLGMKFLLRFAFFGHLIGVLLMIFATGFWMLFAGALTISLANGTVEAVCNPLVATLYPNRKTEKLNQFHVWFPGGIVIGGLLCFFLDKINLGAYQIKLCLILIPTVIYGFLFLRERFPATETHQGGVSFGGLFKESFSRPLFWLLLLCMMMTASIELGPQRWIPAVLESGGIPGILVLVWITGLMAVMRQFAGPVVHKLSPTGILVASAAIAGMGLLWMSYVESTAIAFAAATVFAVGVCYFWPTMLGVTSERIPKGGPLALGLMGGTGALTVGLITSWAMGIVADNYAHQKLEPQQVAVCLQEVVDAYPDIADAAGGKRTLVVRLGLVHSRWGYVTLWALCYASIVGLVLAGPLPVHALLGLATLPLALHATRLLFRHYRSRAVKGPMAGTIQLHLATGLLMILGLWLAV